MLMEKHRVGLDDNRILNAALQYHDIDREKGLFYALQRKGLVERLVDDSQIERAVDNLPEDTRAWLRGNLVSEHRERLSVGWDMIIVADKTN